MTPKVLNIYIKAANQKLNTDYKNLLTQAYLIAAWTRAKRLPNLNKILDEPKPKSKIMTAEEMLAQVQRLNKLHNGEVV